MNPNLSRTKHQLKIPPPLRLAAWEGWWAGRQLQIKSNAHLARTAERAADRNVNTLSLKLSPEDMDLMKFSWQPCPRKEYLCNSSVMVHRLVVRRMIGREFTPGEVVDHINGDKRDSRRENLRITDHSGNQRNKHNSKSKTGFFGVSTQRGKLAYRATLASKVNGKRVVLYTDSFLTALEAAAAYNQAAERHGFLTRNPIPA
jgi:hypothetical protein